MALEFKYDESGQHTHTCEVGGLIFEIYNDLKGSFTLTTFKGGDKSKVVLKSWEACVREATRVVRKAIAEMEAALR